MQWQHHPFLCNVLRVLSLVVVFVAMLYAKTAYNAKSVHMRFGQCLALTACEKSPPSPLSLRGARGDSATSMSHVRVCQCYVVRFRQDFARGEEAYTHGQYKDAITRYERAIKWYTPFSKTVRLAVERLWQLGTEAETRGDWHLALEAYQSLRSSTAWRRKEPLCQEVWLL